MSNGNGLKNSQQKNVVLRVEQSEVQLYRIKCVGNLNKCLCQFGSSEKFMGENRKALERKWERSWKKQGESSDSMQV